MWHVMCSTRSQVCFPRGSAKHQWLHLYKAVSNVLCCRRRDAEIQRWKGLANQARADGQALQAKRDEEAALYSERVQHKPCPDPSACFATLHTRLLLTVLYLCDDVWLSVLTNHCSDKPLGFPEQPERNAASLGQCSF